LDPIESSHCRLSSLLSFISVPPLLTLAVAAHIRWRRWSSRSTCRPWRWAHCTQTAAATAAAGWVGSHCAAPSGGVEVSRRDAAVEVGGRRGGGGAQTLRVDWCAGGNRWAGSPDGDTKGGRIGQTTRQRGDSNNSCYDTWRQHRQLDIDSTLTGSLYACNLSPF